MADYRLAAQMISRADGRSAVAAAAYRSGQDLHDLRTGLDHDYTRKGGVMHEEILAPKAAPDWVKDRETLWNAVETSETRINSQVAREIQISLPHELDHAQRVALTKAFVQENFVSKGMVADIAIHAPPRHGDERNFHAHVMLTTREIGPDGFGKKNRDWNRKEVLQDWRAAWSQTQNQYLAQHLGRKAPQVTHQSYLERGMDNIPGVHLGPAASAIERRKERSHLGDRNRRRQASNARVNAARTRMDQLQEQAYPRVPRDIIDIRIGIISERMRLEEKADDLRKERKDTLAKMKGWHHHSHRNIEKATLAPFENEVKLAKKELHQAVQKHEKGATPRQIMAWFRNPAGQVWQTLKTDEVISEAASKLQAAEKKRGRAEAWLQSPDGQKKVMDKYNELQPEYAKLRTKERKLRRNLAQTKRHLEVAKRHEQMLKAMSQSGIVTLNTSVRGLDSRLYLNGVQAGIAEKMRSLAPQQKQRLQQSWTQILNPSLGLGR
ncbi:MAG: MobA/MobL family protein [Rhodospirillales bacterium]|nr:MobA/MobL family protein [Rhodospirillales bacterium]